MIPRQGNTTFSAPIVYVVERPRDGVEKIEGISDQSSVK